MWIGRILLLGYLSSVVARWTMSPAGHRRYVAGWLRAFRKATGWLPRGRHRSRRLATKVFCSTLKQRHSLKPARRSQQPQAATAKR